MYVHHKRIKELLTIHNEKNKYEVGGSLLPEQKFLLDWIDENIIYFIDDNEDILYENNINSLFAGISNYKKNIQTKKIAKHFNNFAKKDTVGKKTVQELIDRNIPRLIKIKEDITFFTTTEKNKQLLDIIEDFISSPYEYFPTFNKQFQANNTELRKFLVSLNLSSYAIKELLDYLKPHI